ncbi:MAG: hypothetical protein HQ592_08580 [Planctomycetes bacterium]|nr:hypothetical protein [Planctomycetota bacterium]
MSARQLKGAELRRKLELEQKRMSRVVLLMKINLYLFLAILLISLATEHLFLTIIATFVVAVNLPLLVRHNLIKVILALHETEGEEDEEDRGKQAA